MNATDPQTALRPLGLGEVLDRAVNLCIKFFVPFSTIYIVYAVPFAIVAYFATKDFQTMLQSITDIMQQSTATGRTASQARIAQQLAQGGAFNAWTVIVIVLAVFVAPLPAAALIDATASTYLGRLPTFGESYRVGVARWLPMIGVNILYGVAGGLLYLAIVLVVVVVFFALAFLTSTLHAVGIAIDVVIGLAMAIVGIAFAIVATLALQVSYFTCVVERANSLVAFSRGITRVFVGVGLKRSLLVGAAFLAIGIAIGVVSLVGQSILVGVLKSSIAGTAYATIVRIATAAFTTAFVAIFYYDLRVREEGLDLTLAAEGARLPDVLETI